MNNGKELEDKDESLYTC